MKFMLYADLPTVTISLLVGVVLTILLAAYFLNKRFTSRQLAGGLQNQRAAHLRIKISRYKIENHLLHSRLSISPHGIFKRNAELYLTDWAIGITPGTSFFKNLTGPLYLPVLITREGDRAVSELRSYDNLFPTSITTTTWGSVIIKQHDLRTGIGQYTVFQLDAYRKEDRQRLVELFKKHQLTADG